MKDIIGDPIRAQRSGSDGERTPARRRVCKRATDAQRRRLASRSDSGAYELCTSGQSEGCARGSDDDAEEVLAE